MLLRSAFLAAYLMLPSMLAAQRTGLGVQLRGYPAGLISNALVERRVGPRLFLAALGGYNFTNRRDFGRHDDERGGGPGLGLGLTRSGPQRSGLQWGVGAELWNLHIDWRDGASRSGETRVLVLQPGAKLGYGWTLGDSRTVIDISIGLGREVNLRTRGEPVGQGPILLLGFGLQRRLGVSRTATPRNTATLPKPYEGTSPPPRSFTPGIPRTIKDST